MTNPSIYTQSELNNDQRISGNCWPEKHVCAIFMGQRANTRDIQSVVIYVYIQVHELILIIGWLSADFLASWLRQITTLPHWPVTNYDNVFREPVESLPSKSNSARYHQVKDTNRFKHLKLGCETVDIRCFWAGLDRRCPLGDTQIELVGYAR